MDSAGEIAGVTSVWIDVTREEALLASERLTGARLRLLQRTTVRPERCL